MKIEINLVGQNQLEITEYIDAQMENTETNITLVFMMHIMSDMLDLKPTTELQNIASTAKCFR